MSGVVRRALAAAVALLVVAGDRHVARPAPPPRRRPARRSAWSRRSPVPRAASTTARDARSCPAA